MHKFWNDIFHLRTWSLGAAVVLGLVAWNISTGLMCLFISTGTQIIHTKHWHRNENQWLGHPTRDIELLILMLAVFATGTLPSVYLPAIALTGLSVMMYDVSIHRRQHTPRHPVAHWGVTAGAATLALVGALIERWHH